MPFQTNFATQATVIPYLTNQEYLNAPTAVDTSNLIPSGSPAAEAAELTNVLRRASNWVDTFCNFAPDGHLAATVNVEMRRHRPNRMGEIPIRPKFFPVIEVRDFEYGVVPNQLQPVGDLTTIFVEQRLITLTSGVATFTVNNGRLGFGPNYGFGPLFIRYTYVNGYPNTLLVNGSYNAGTNQITVADTTGIYGNTVAVPTAGTSPPASLLTIYDGSATEQVSIASVNATTGVLTLNGTLAFTHIASASSPVSVSAMPAAVKEATTLYASALIKTRGHEAVVLDTVGHGPGRSSAVSGAELEDVLVAEDLLVPYRREF